MSNHIEMNYGEIGHDTWAINLDGKYAAAIHNYLESDGIPTEGVDKIIDNAALALSYCPNPIMNDKCQKTGLVIGKVQSGKTSSFISIAALAFDNGYSIVLVLGGTKKPLVKQNRDRIKEYFASTKDVLVLDTTDNKDELNARKIYRKVKTGKKIIIVALKNATKINYLMNNVFNTPDLNEKATLIIDDEGDEASLNTLVSKGRKSSTYKAIENLKGILNRHCFLSITATPQANLLIDTLDILSPDFGVLVDPGHGYCGLDVFHSSDRYIEKIEDSETSLLDAGIPPSFIKAISMFFVACAIFKKRGMEPEDKMSMLIHPSQKKADHELVYKKVDELVAEWIEKSDNKNDIAYNSVQKVFKAAYDEYAKLGVWGMCPFEVLEDDIIDVVKDCGIHKINGDSVQKNPDEFYDYNIYVGGTMLGRGLTLKGLTITYIIRTSRGTSMADTVQQRARWFGYKTRYLDLCKIFAVGKIIKEFQDIRDHEEDLWDTVRQTNCHGVRFKDMARIFTLSDNLLMTRRSVAKADNYTFTLWNKQRLFQSDADYIKNNISILQKVRDDFSKSVCTVSYGGGSPYKIIYGLDFAYVKEHILDKFCFVNGEKFNRSVINKLASLLSRKGISPKVDLIWMREALGKYSNHNIDGNKRIPNYSVGRRPKDETKAAVYLGDDYQFVKDDVMQLQIHNIMDNATKISSPTIAFYIPRQIIGKLTNLVIQSN